VEQEPRNFAAYNLLGVCAVQRKDAVSAESYFRKSLALNPQFSEARINLALNLLQRGKLQAATMQLEEVLRLEPDNPIALYHLGKSETVAGASGRAVTHLRRAHELSPGDVKITLALARAYLAAGQREAAGKLVEPVLGQEPPTQILLPAALIALEAGQADLARQALERNLPQDPKMLEEILRQARELSTQGSYETVRGLLEAVGPAGEDSAEGNALLGYAEYKLRDPGKAATHLQRAIELAPQVEEYYLKMGELLLFHNSDQAAADFCKRGLQNIPNSAALHFALAVADWSHQLDSDAAVGQLNTALSIEPDFQSALELLCLIQHRQKKWEALEQTADHLIRVNPNFSPGYYFKGAALEARAPHSERPQATLAAARKLLEKSVRLQPQFAESHVGLGELLEEQGELGSAIAEFQQAIKIDPNNSQGFYHLANAYRQAGELAKSKLAFDKFNQLKAEKKEKEGWEELFHISK
jgi:superkiller protein 3